MNRQDRNSIIRLVFAVIAVLLCVLCGALQAVLDLGLLK